ncbi:MAG TPA: asparagine synthase-related protein, partial [Sphingomonas sp.]|nr:asparagine synthase-related protein [Sphingomonas sp.]
LMGDGWGRYLAVTLNAGAIEIAREPSGAIGCYYQHREGRIVCASDAVLLTQATGCSPGFDWDEVLAQLQYRNLRTERTGLAGIRELPPGAALRLRNGELRRRGIWSPYPFAANWNRRARFEDAQPLVRRAILGTVAALARDYQRPVVKLSGGLDSSLVTAALAASGAHPTCLTFRGTGADLDETAYAQAVVARTGSPHAIATFDRAAVSLAHDAAAHLPRPTARLFAQADDALQVELARRIGADAFFSGGGGDTVLWYFPTVSAALDRLRCGSLAGFWQTLGDLAQMTGDRRIRALRIALAKLARREAQPWFHTLRFLAREAQPLAVPGWHPWLPVPAGTLPGVRAYVRSLIQMQDHYEHGARLAFGPAIPPLLAQPVVEQCLAIPSWLWCAGGRDRAVARAAFADLLPAEIIERRTKGGADGFVTRLLNGARREARPLLLDGLLARQNLLDRGEIEQVLTQPGRIGSADCGRLSRLISVETWLRSWSARRAGG